MLITCREQSEPADDKRDLLTLAREDFQHQQSVDDGVAARLRFLLTAVTLVASASLGLAGIQPASGAVARLLVIAALWFAVAEVIVCALLAYRTQTWSEPRTIDDYLQWASNRVRQLQKQQVSDEQASEIARDNMIDRLIAAYASSAAANRRINQHRLRMLAWARLGLMAATILLGVQALIVVVN